MGYYKENVGAGTRWFVRLDDQRGMLTTGFLLFLALAFPALGLGAWDKLSGELMWVGGSTVILWGWFFRRAALTRRGAQYELVIDKSEVRWGWSHKPETQTRLAVSTLSKVEYYWDPESSTLTLFTWDGKKHRVSSRLAQRPQFGAEIVDHFSEHFPEVTVET